MNKNKLNEKAYITPLTEIIAIDSVHTIMAGSPLVQPGGTVTIEPPTEDDEDTEITG